MIVRAAMGERMVWFRSSSDESEKPGVFGESSLLAAMLAAVTAMKLSVAVTAVAMATLLKAFINAIQTVGAEKIGMA